MALTTPSIETIQSNIITDLESRFGTPIPLLSKAVWRVLAVVLSGIWIILYTYGTDAFKQRFIQTADISYLKLLGAVVGITQLPATVWSGTCSITHTAGEGKTLTAGLVTFINLETETVYSANQTVTIGTGATACNIVCLTGGDAGNLNIGDSLTFVSPIAGIDETTIVSAVTIYGDDAESEIDYRQRVLTAYQTKPQGGASIDYVLWAKTAPNVSSAYPYATIGTPGKVDLYIEVDNETDGIPTAGQLSNIYSGYIDINPDTLIQERRPLTAEINMLPIYRMTVDVNIVSLSPDNATIRAAILDALTTQLLTYEPYISGVTINRNDYIKKSKLSSVTEDVTDLYSATFDDIILSVSAVPFSSEVLARGQKAKLGTVSYTT